MHTFFVNEPLIAIIGDIRNSRELERRKAIQDKLKSVLEEINSEYKEEIASRFIITLGDEFQGLLLKGNNLLKIIQEIKSALYPVELRFGIGVGKITTDINMEMALGADGPGYYKAREAIEIIKENEKKNRAVVSDIRVEKEKADEQVLLLNTVFELMKAVENEWTKRQREIIWNMLKYQDGQQKAAQRMGITQAAVHKVLIRGNYYVYEKAMKNVREVLGEIKI